MGFFFGADQRFNVCLAFRKSLYALSGFKKDGNKLCLLTNKWSEIKPVFHLSTNNLESDFVYGNNCQLLMQIMLTSTASCCIKFRVNVVQETTGLTEWKYLDYCKNLLFLPEQIFPAYFTEKRYRKGMFLGSWLLE